MGRLIIIKRVGSDLWSGAPNPAFPERRAAVTIQQKELQMPSREQSAEAPVPSLTSHPAASAPPPTCVESLVAARIILDPEDMFVIWRSAMTIPAAAMVECLQFTNRRLSAQAALMEAAGLYAFPAASKAADSADDAQESASGRSGVAAHEEEETNRRMKSAA